MAEMNQAKFYAVVVIDNETLLRKATQDLKPFSIFEGSRVKTYFTNSISFSVNVSNFFDIRLRRLRYYFSCFLLREVSDGVERLVIAKAVCIYWDRTMSGQG